MACKMRPDSRTRPYRRIDAYAMKIKGESMTTKLKLSILATAALVSLAGAGILQAQQNNMSFFVTSAGSGKGGDLGGLAGADAHCTALAQAAGAAGQTRHAHLSSHTPPRGQATNAP